ncbi:MAG: alpha/beta fold hydrolase [Candidatus Obscuribacterales bacterium]|nr:alpha/beta fold hydrolase [Candidatus Obscuribacterales bacterium]
MPVRAFLTIAVLFAIISGTSIRLPPCKAQTPAASIDQAQKKKIFQTFAEMFFRGQCKDAYLMLSPLMQKALTEERMPVVLKQLEMRFGTFQSVNNIRVNKSSIPGMSGIQALCQFSGSTANLEALINDDGKISSFFVKAPTNFKEPPYAKHEQFTERDIEIPSAELRLKATLSVPVANGPFPCVVLVHGSGPCDRDETVGSIKVFRDIAWGLASNGIAALRYEKRTRQFPTKPINTVNDETVDDAVAAIECLKTQSAIDKTRLVVLGHSLGALMAPRIAQREINLAGVVICAGPTRKLEDIIVCQIAYLDSLVGDTGESDNLKNVKEQALKIKSLDRKDALSNSNTLIGFKPSWWLDMQNYDPVKTAQTINSPILIMQGDRDYQVNLEDFKGWQDGMKGRPGVTLKLYPGLAHTFTSAADKPGPGDYDKPLNVAPSVIDDLSTWIKTLTPVAPVTP